MRVATSEFIDLCRSLLREDLAVSFEVTGDSMAPAIEPGDLVQLEPLAADAVAPAPGEIVAFVRGDRLYVHRVTGRWSQGVLVRGDNRADVDGRVRREDLLGRVGKITKCQARPRAWTAISSAADNAALSVAALAARLRA